MKLGASADGRCQVGSISEPGGVLDAMDTMYQRGTKGEPNGTEGLRPELREREGQRALAARRASVRQPKRLPSTRSQARGPGHHR